MRRIALVCAISFLGMVGQGVHAAVTASVPKAPSSTPNTSKPSDQVRFPVTKYTLPNGLTVLISEDHKAPLVSYQQWFRVGSSYESVGHTGLAHFFEHLMFKGTKKYPEVKFNHLMEVNGASFNAFTTEDYTGFYMTLPSRKIELAIDLESDRMHNLQFDNKLINSERQVVEEERRMRYENSVSGALWLLFRSTLYKTSPYHWPVIGYMPDLNAMKLEEFRQWYRSYYAPNNAVVTIVGDVNTAKVKKLIAKYYGPLPPSKIPPFHPTPEAPQLAPRSATEQKDVQGVSMILGYPGVKAGDPDQYALDMLSSIMADGPSSRLYQSIIYKSHLATSVWMNSDENVLAGDIAIGIGWDPGANIHRGVAVINKQIEAVKANLVSKDEMTKVRNAMLLGYIRGLQTDESKAESLAYNEIVFHDYNELFTDLDKMSSVTRRDIQHVAKKYLTPSRLNTVEIVPKESK